MLAVCEGEPSTGEAEGARLLLAAIGRQSSARGEGASTTRAQWQVALRAACASRAALFLAKWGPFASRRRHWFVVVLAELGLGRQSGAAPKLRPLFSGRTGNCRKRAVERARARLCAADCVPQSVCGRVCVGDFLWKSVCKRVSLKERLSHTVSRRLCAAQREARKHATCRLRASLAQSSSHRAARC